MEIFLVVLCVILCLFAIVVFSPVVIAIDSHGRQVRIRWLFILEFRMPMPWTAGEKHLYVLRRPVALRAEQPSAKPAGEKYEAAKASAETPGRQRKRRAIGRFFVRCLGDSTIRRTLARQLARLLRRVAGSISLTRSGSGFSLPDPALNGMLVGALSASEWGQRSGIRVNFTGENSLFLELRFHPHRVFKAFLFFLPGLPYRAMFRQWRALPAVRPQ